MRVASAIAFFAVAMVAYGLAPAAAQVVPSMTPKDPLCLNQRQLYDWQAGLDNMSVIASDRSHRKYKLSFRTPCGGLDFNMGIGFKSQSTSSLSCLARGDQVISRDPARPGQRCIIDKVEVYTAAMQHADAAAKAMDRPH